MRPVTLHTLMHHTGQARTVKWRPERLSTDTARRLIRRGRRNNAAVRVYATTDRDGTPMHVAYVEFGPGLYDNVDAVTDIYEIPTEALTSL
ncbi:hypothetical protein [Streptomyces virginiae]|uniref:hypothetical protein n=1 Tax=Streptomyces virginiae TaxID=1961 RepID=UPI00225B0B50|nr:hypothetical protein [Streptomyces virginiae]MCX5273753.1 hypothetical protein [Streptomyces virginiae]